MVTAAHIRDTGMILVWLLAAGLDLSGQLSPFDPGVTEEAAMIREEVIAFTDRSLYITGEEIKFRASIHTSGFTDQKNWSRVLNVELVTATGESKARGKFRVYHHVSSGGISVPGDVLTGNYFFKCYTRWMRNRDPSAFCFIPLRIVNPESPELYGETGGDNNKMIQPAGYLREDVVKIRGASSVYNRGDTVILDLVVTGTGGTGIAEGCIAAVPVEIKPLAQLNAEGNETGLLNDFHLQYLPDLYGATLSGSVVDRDQDEQGVKNVLIHFTLMGNQSGYFVARSDNYGKFSVTLPEREGNLELLVKPESVGDDALEVRIDHDYDQRELSLPTGPFSLSESESKVVTVMARKVQLRDIYGTGSSFDKTEVPSGQVPFYGLPTFSLNMDEFVLLPTLEEVFINLVPDVSPVTRKNRVFLSIDSENPTLSMFEPLIMIDQVPFFNMDQFLSLPTDRISRIDVVNDIYLKGDLRFGGIVNVRTRERDMAGIDLPDNAFFIDFAALYPDPGERREKVMENDKMPDTRNTLLWIPELQVERGNPSTITFTAPDYPGEYVVLFRGEDERGEPVTAETRIIVK